MNQFRKSEIRDNSIIIIIAVFLFSLIYAVLRYNVFKGVPWIDFPTYVFNKVLSLSALILFVLNHFAF